MAILDIRNIKLAFGGLLALKDISLTVGDNELLGIIGPNGSGKTSLFNVITCLYHPAQGSVLFKGQELVGKSMYKVARYGIFRTFQNLQLFDRLTVVENVLMGQYHFSKAGISNALFGRKKLREIEEKQFEEALDLLELVGLTDKKDYIAGSLAYGDQRRVEIARALAGRPDLLLLDEPSAGLNPNEKEIIMQLIRKIKADKKIAMILVEHNMRVLMGVSDRVIVFNQGEIIAEGLPKDVQRNPDVISVYLGTTKHNAEQ